MITGLIALIIVIAVLPPAIENGQGGVVAVAIAFIVFLLMMGFIGLRDARAYGHVRNYLAMSGKDRAKARHRWDEEAREEERRKREVLRRKPGKYEFGPSEPTKWELDDAARKRVAYMESLRNGTERLGQTGPYRVCHACGRGNRVSGQRILTGDGRMVTFTCPRCGCVNMTKLGA